MEEEIRAVIKRFLEDVDEDSLRRGEVWSLDKFKSNVGKIGVELVQQAPEKKIKLVKALKAAGLQLIASIPIVTPIVTAFLEVVTSEDLGMKIDEGFNILGKKMDKMLSLQEKTLSLQEKTISLQEKTIALQEKTIALQEKTLSLQQKTLSLQEKTLSLQEKTIEILEERLPSSKGKS